MRVNSVGNQNFGMNPSNAVRACMTEVALGGKDIKPFIKAVKDIYPYKFLTMLGDSKKVQAVGITDTFEAIPRIDKALPEKWVPEYEKHMHDSYFWMGGRRRWTKSVDYEGEKLFERHAVPAILPPFKDGNYLFLFKDIEGKPFAKIVDSLTESLQKIKDGFTPAEKIANDLEQEFPQYRKILSEGDASRIARDANWHNQRIG